MSTNLLDQLRAYGDDFVAAQDEIRLEDLGDRPVSIDPIPKGTRRGWVVAFATAIIVLVLVGGALLVGGPFSSDQVPVVTQPLPAWESWERVGADVMDPAVGLFDLTQTGSGLIAVGFDPGEDLRQDGVIFASEDGLTWTRIAEDDPALTTGTVLIYSITRGGPGLVAVGVSCEDAAFPCEMGPHPTVWTSPDGTAWTRSSAAPAVFGALGAMEDVVVTDHGIVAAGWLTGSDADDVVWTSPAVWLSADGADWSRVWGGNPGNGDPISAIDALAVGPNGLIVAVGSAENTLGEAVAAVWTSTDARIWERVDPDSPAFGSQIGANIFTPEDVAWGSSGFIAVGTQGAVAVDEFGGSGLVDTQVAIWHSPDGRSWTKIDTADQPTGGGLSAVTALESGFVAAGPGFGDSGGAPVTLWTSADGLTWDRAGEIGPGSAQAIVMTDLGIAVAGQATTAEIPTADDYHASVWTGPTFDPEPNRKEES